jgi:photosystem II stability/assembly factor-like uncharacterized protein
MSWIPIGPISLRSISVYGHQPLSGRARAIAVDETGRRVYVAAANGGVFRSDDGGASWGSTMDDWFVDATTMHSSSLACGAIAIHPTNRDRVFVGTGEDNWFGGVGPLRTDTGGTGATPWVIEPVAAGSPSLARATFTALAIDPNYTDRVVAATSQGVYRREPDGMGGFHWVQTLAGQARDLVAVSAGGATTFYVALRGPAAIKSSSDGASWSPGVGGALPVTTVGELQLGVQPHNANLIYALYCDPSCTTGALWRLDLPDPTWRVVSGLPSLFVGQNDLQVAVNPTDATQVFLGSVSLYRASVGSSGSGSTLAYEMTPTLAWPFHNDMHDLVYVAGDGNKLWCGCDGGAFYSDNAAGTITWQAKNVGLATLQVYAIGLHPTEDAVAFIGTQDNGIIRYDGDEVWRNLTNMDGGSVLVNWHDPYKVLAAAQGGAFSKATDGAQDFSSWTSVNVPDSFNTLATPAAGTPPDPSNPASADLVAAGGAGRPWLSSTFGGSWYSIPNNDVTDDLPGGDKVNAVTFASARMLYVGTSSGAVYLYTLSGAAWSRAALPANPNVQSLARIVVDPSDPTLNSIYVVAYSAVDFRHVWRFDGTSWSARSGPAAGDAAALPNFIYNALAVDAAHPLTLFAGSDTGLWQTIDGGLHWSRFDDNLPRAPIMDIMIHPTRRTIYAATYGRGVYARDLDVAAPPGIELYIRDDALDLGKRTTVDWLPDPLSPGNLVVHWEGPDVKVDAPSGGMYQLTPPINDFQFVDQLQDLSGATETAAVGSPVLNRVYVQVHNRGLTTANGVYVMLLIANASTTLPDLPSGFQSNVQTQTPIANADWQTVGIARFDGITVGHPHIFEFDLPSTFLPPPASLPGNSHWCLLALVHQGEDMFTNPQVHVDTLTTTDRKATNKNLHVVAVGLGAHRRRPRWYSLRLNGLRGFETAGDLIIDLRGFKGGAVRLLVPKSLERFVAPELAGAVGMPRFAQREDGDRGGRSPGRSLVEQLERSIREMRDLEKARAFNVEWCRQMGRALEQVVGSPARSIVGGQELRLLANPIVPSGEPATVFLGFDAPPGAAPGERFRVRVYHRGVRQTTGGATYELGIVK